MTSIAQLRLRSRFPAEELIRYYRFPYSLFHLSSRSPSPCPSIFHGVEFKSLLEAPSALLGRIRGLFLPHGCSAASGPPP